MAKTFAVFQPATQAPFQQRTYGAAWGAALGEVKDELMALMKLGTMARLPMFAPLDALGELATERGIFQGPAESIAHFVPRLLNAWGEWTLGGTYWGLLAQLYGSGYTTAYIVAANGFVYGPSNGVTAPDPINGIAGTPPAFVQLPPWYASGSAPASNEWQASTTYALNAIVTPDTQNGTWFIATQGGTSGASSPTWPGPGGHVTDGGVTWYYGGNYDSAPVYPPWTFGAANGQGDPGVLGPLGPGDPLGVSLGGPADPTGAFWSRFIVMFDPYPASWTDVVNPPTNTTSPTVGEIGLIQSIIATWQPGKSTCVGIVAANGAARACLAWPLTKTTNIPFSCWLSRAIVTGDAPTSTAFVATRPESVYSWLPHTAVANAGGSTYIFTVPSSAYQVANPGTNYLYSSPASSGTTGLVEPTWPTTIGSTVTDNGITWTCVASLTAWNQANGATTFQAA